MELGGSRGDGMGSPSPRRDQKTELSLEQLYGRELLGEGQTEGGRSWENPIGFPPAAAQGSGLFSAGLIRAPHPPSVPPSEG